MPTKFKLYAGLYTALFLLFSVSLFAQTSITGHVFSKSDGKPISGATVQVKGGKSATLTGQDGSFTITSSQKVSALIITVVGYESQTVPVNGTSVGDISLAVSSTTLNDVVVTGYTSQKRKDITGAVAVVNVNNMKEVPGTSAEALLQGQAAGVTVINSGAPGGGSNVHVRGVGSIGNVDPLYIIDGVQGDLQNMNMSDIENIQVLKDAGATAIYGIQGANGVVIITTKKGRGGKATITYDGFVGTQQPLKNGFNLGGSQNYADVEWMEYYNNGIVPGNNWFGNGNASGYVAPTLPTYLAPTPFVTVSNAIVPNPNYTADQNPATYDIVNNQITQTNLTGTDWFHELFKPAPWTQHTISASQATDKSSYYMSASYLDQQGTMIDTYLKRYSLRMNTSFNIKDAVTLGENAYFYFKQNPYIQNQNEGNAISFSYRIPPIIPVYDIMGNYAGTHSFTINNSDNPVAYQNRQANNENNTTAIQGNIFADVNFLKYFTFHTSLGGSYGTGYYYNFTYTPYNNAEGSTAANSYDEGAYYNSEFVWTNTLAYNKNFGNLGLKALAGTESKQFYGRGLQAGRSSYFSTSTDYWSLNGGNPLTQSNADAANGSIYPASNGSNTGLPYQSTIYSQFGRVDLSWEDKYLLTGTIRRDQSSIFAPGEQTGVFPSVSAGWRMSQEDFMRGISWIKDLKLRGSWGKSGNLSNVPTTNPYTLYGSNAFNSYYDLGGTSTTSQQGFFNSNIGNAGTTWETDVLTDVGVDATLDHFTLTFDYFKKKVSGLLFQDIAATTLGGAVLPYVNLGDIQNTGFDFALGYHDQVSSDFKFDLTLTGTHYVSKVLSLPPGYQYFDVPAEGSTRIGDFSRLQVGHAVGEFYGYKVNGYFSSASDVAKSPVQSGAAPGAFKFADLDGNDTITTNDRTFIGNPNPKFTYGFNIAATYKNFDFSAFFYGSYGNQDFNYVKYWIDFPQVFQGNVSADLIANSWSPSNLNPKYPQITSASTFSNTTQVNSWYVENGSYLRLKTLNIGYTINPAVLQKAGINRLRIYVSGSNLFTITKYTGLDPELQGSNLNDQTNIGIDFGNYPANQKTYIVGINLTF
jgi:TonB-dependent starch-binding outer membrane protein SusC